MRRTGTVLAWTAAVFVVAAIVSPWIYWAVQGMAHSIRPLRPLADNPFPRYLSRTLLIVAIVALVLMRRALGKPTWRELGLSFDGNMSVALCRGFALGFLTLGVVIAAALIAGHREWRNSIALAGLATTILISILGAGLAAPLEEIVFRGVLFGGLRGRGWIVPLIISSGIFAAVHFLQTPRPSQLVSWTSGFEVLQAMIVAGSIESRIPQFVNLFLCGMILGWAYQRTGSLAFSIGLHGGWIFWLKLGNALTTVAASNAFWGTRKLIDGWVATASLLAAASLLPFVTRSLQKQNSDVIRISEQAPAVD